MTQFNKFIFVLSSIVLFTAFITPTMSTVYAAETNSKKNKSKKYYRTVKRKKSDKLVILNEMPNSGAARESGYDGRHAMESTSKRDSDYTRCAKASRGLIMLDNKQLRKCGGRPKGWAKAAKK